MAEIHVLDRTTVRAPKTILVLSQADYDAALAYFEMKDRRQWLPDDCAGCVSEWDSPNHGTVCVVSLRAEDEDRDAIAVACTLVHEAVHVFQILCQRIGEDEPGIEFQAYSVERISENLMREYVRRMKEAA